MRVKIAKEGHGTQVSVGALWWPEKGVPVRPGVGLKDRLGWADDIRREDGIITAEVDLYDEIVDEEFEESYEFYAFCTDLKGTRSDTGHWDDVTSARIVEVICAPIPVYPVTPVPPKDD